MVREGFLSSPKCIPGVEELEVMLQPLGLARRSARAISRLAEYLLQQDYGLGIPTKRRDLTKLPYVGEYVADAWLCFALGEKRLAVDSGVRRVLARLYAEESWLRARAPSAHMRAVAAVIADIGKARVSELN